MDEDLPILERIQGGDEYGLKALMDRHREAVFHFTLRYCGNEADAAELTSETFFRVYKYAHRYQPRAKVRTWIFAIAANLSRDHLRRHKKRRKDISLQTARNDDAARRLEEEIPGGECSPAERTDLREQMRAVQAVIQRLPHKLRFPLVFCVLEDNSHEECATVLGISAKAVETRIYRARKFIQKQLKES